MTVLKFILFILSGFLPWVSFGQLQSDKSIFTRADTLRGTNGPFRQQWNVLHYDITVQPDHTTKAISGKNTLTFYDEGARLMQIDLQEPMILDSVVNEGISYRFSREKNVYWLEYRDTSSLLMYKIKPGIRKLTFYFHGKPREAVRPPWDGGWIWKKDKNGDPWMTVACQALGASVWYPCKDIQSDKPDSGATLHIIVPDSLVAVGNGRLTDKRSVGNRNTMYTWNVKNPINNYCIVPYIGKYVRFGEEYQGLKGNLDMNYWVMHYNLDKAKLQFTDAPKMMKAFEHWFGPFPFYEDGYQLVEAPYLGMEHQSALAYGNQYKKGYFGNDLSGTGEGLKWDFIIVHESGHEWFANSICTNDIADMWVHEGFTNYSETLFTEYYWGKAAGETYVQGLRQNIQNDKPVIGPYGVNKEGSGDMYYKASNMLHLIRQITNNDEKFHQMLLGLNRDFYHQTVTSRQIEQYIAKKLNLDLAGVFDQYLRTVNIPTLDVKREKNKMKYRWINAVSHLKIPLKISFGTTAADIMTITPGQKWKTLRLAKKYAGKPLTADRNFYIKVSEPEP
ncbi:MAG: M1 family metallopeptidase [Ferruginibacter sp.]